MDSSVCKEVITCCDLTPFTGLTPDQEIWLRTLVKHVDSSSLSLCLSGSTNGDTEPIAFFDERSSSWWAGRFVGELHYQDRTLRILPRFGMSTLMRWLSRIWGIKISSSTGTYQHDRIWLWEVIARLYTLRLLAAAKHGLPYSRVYETHVGLTARGRLKVRETALTARQGCRGLVSATRNRKLNPLIGGTILSAFDYLRRQLKHIGNESLWLTSRGKYLVDEMQATLSKRDLFLAQSGNEVIRYTPITEGYRPVVELSRAILRKQPISSSVQGEKKVFGILLDMAEIWELYIYNLLKWELHAFAVMHTGRLDENSGWLLQSPSGLEKAAKLKPDVLIHNRANRCLYIVDAKYKRTSASIENPTGVHREDLYQMAAYFSAFGVNESALEGSLVYPADDASRVSAYFEPNNPWVMTSNTKRRLNFYAVDSKYSHDRGLNESEKQFLKSVYTSINI